MTNEEMFKLILDEISVIKDNQTEMKKDISVMKHDISSLKKQVTNIEHQNETIAIQVSENNQILKQENVKEWLELGSSAISELKKKRSS